MSSSIDKTAESKETNSTTAANVEVAAPIAEHRNHTVYFGKVDGEDRGPNPMNPPRTRNDPLFWLRDDARSNSQVLDHLRKEKAYYEYRTQDIKPLIEEIYQEHISHIKETDKSAEYEHGPFYYYTREEAGKSYKIYCRRPKPKAEGYHHHHNHQNKKINANVKHTGREEDHSVNAEKPEEGQEEILMDVNAMAEGKPFCDVHELAPAPPHHDTVAYSVDWSGNEVYTIAMQVNPHHYTDEVKGTNGSIEWDKEGLSFFYITKDDTLRDNKVWRHIMGSAQSEDVCLYTENDPLFSVFVCKSMDSLTCMIGSVSSETTEVSLLDLRKGVHHNTLELVKTREQGVRYDVNMHGPDTLIILTNAHGAVNNKIIQVKRHSMQDWSHELVSHREDLLIQEILVCKYFMVCETRRAGLTRVWFMTTPPIPHEQHETDTKENENTTTPEFNVSTWQELHMQEPVYTIELASSQMNVYETLQFRIIYSSLATPQTWMDVNVFAPTEQRTVIKTREVGGGFTASDYVVEQRFATAPDKTRIPISLVYHKDLNVTGKEPHPCMLYGYGSYGLSMNPEFAIKYLPYLERGMIYAIAHIRGGAENGRAWYEIGAKYLTKRNTFSDFIACAEYLIENKLTCANMLACEGRSAGGLLMGAVLNMRPDLFKVAIAGVPFVDVMTTMCDPSIPLTTGEWEEWGNPNEYKYFDYMLSYSPIDNVRAQEYPAIMVQAGLHDPRVAYWEPAKWVSKLRELKTDTNEIVLNMDLESGHFSAKDRYKYWRESAIQQAFVCKHLKRMTRCFLKKEKHERFNELLELLKKEYELDLKYKQKPNRKN